MYLYDKQTTMMEVLQYRIKSLSNSFDMRMFEMIGRSSSCVLMI
jgi:hypothetical protein